FHGTIGVPPCGPKSPPVELPSEGVLLREIVCRVAREGVFHHLLTPNFTRAHLNHLPVDIKRDARGYLLRYRRYPSPSSPPLRRAYARAAPSARWGDMPRR